MSVGDVHHSLQRDDWNTICVVPMPLRNILRGPYLFRSTFLASSLRNAEKRNNSREELVYVCNSLSMNDIFNKMFL